MASYWVIVRRGRGELLDALASAFDGREAFAVIEDRRGEVPPEREDDRRSAPPPWDASDFVLTERVSLLE